jgi:hypothetical protein
MFNDGDITDCRDFYRHPGNSLVDGKEINMALIITGIVIVITSSISLALKIQEIRKRDA